MEHIYLDHAATTPVFDEVIDVMASFMRTNIGNPSSIHSLGQEAKISLEQARAQVAALIGATPEQIVFTSGGTEADNLVIFGAARIAAQQGKKHIITSAVEHHAVLESCQALQNQGFELSILPVDKFGMVSPQSLSDAIREDTFLVSIMHANNEVGTINPISQLADIAHRHNALFHTDAVQSVGKIAVDVNELNVDFLTYSSHKINGPKGVGALFVKDRAQISRCVWGGGQEATLRSGTENMPGIVGFGKAAEITAQRWQESSRQWQYLRDKLVNSVLEQIPESYINGHPQMRLPHNANVSFDYIESEALLQYLDLNGIACSSGSACSSGEEAPSHVLTAMGIADGLVHSAVRFSLGYGVDEKQIDKVVSTLVDKVQLLRRMSPFYKK